MSRIEQIGGATLYLGDCLEILPALPRVEMVFTDPPYGHNNNNNDLIHNREKALGVAAGAASEEKRPILNDGPEANDIFRAMLRLVVPLLPPGCCCCCCCCGGGPDPQFARWSLWMDEALEFKQAVVWDKGPMGMGWHYRRSYEVVLVAMKAGAACHWYDETSRVENIIRPNAVGKILPAATDHPTVKPVALGAHFIKLHSAIGGAVLDPFMGSGTTGVACANLGRKFIGIELDPKYFDMACRRIEDAYRQQRLFPVEETTRPVEAPRLFEATR